MAFLDDDDLWPADKLRWQVDALRANDWCAVGGTTVLMHQMDQVKLAKQQEMKFLTIEAMFSGTPFMSPGQVLIRRSSLESCRWLGCITLGEATILTCGCVWRAMGHWSWWIIVLYITEFTNGNASRATDLMFWNLHCAYCKRTHRYCQLRSVGLYADGVVHGFMLILGLELYETHVLEGCGKWRRLPPRLSSLMLLYATFDIELARFDCSRYYAAGV